MFWLSCIGVAAVSAGLLVALLYVYVSNHRHLRSPFSLGLVFFAALLLVQNLGSIYFYLLMADAGEGPSVAIPMFGLDLVELVGFAILFFVTWR
ncbi:MAG TPA: hypothetical protein VIB49_10440 [Thermoplasmata archaeon]